MARKLPWTTDATTSATAAASAADPHSRSRKRMRDTSISRHFTTPAQTNRVHEEESEPTTTTASRITQTPRRQQGTGSPYRTPSTSPPPAPPAIEFMREGWDADDGYIMVEDEFQAVAQRFTVGLHHAEYSRLKREARERSRKAGQGAGAVGLGGGVGVGVGAGLAGKRREIAERQRQGLGEVTRVRDEGSSGSSEEEREKKAEIGSKKKRKKDLAEADVEDLWAGTKLAGLMTSRSQEKTSLMGLGRLATSTRAALGFGPSGDEQGTGDKGRARVDLSKGSETVSSRKVVTGVVHEERAAPQMKSEKAADDHVNEQAVKKEAQKSGSSLKLSAVRPSKNRFVDDLDDFDGDAWDKRQAEESKQPRKEPESSETFRPRKARPAKPKSRLDEVPVFLI